MKSFFMSRAKTQRRKGIFSVFAPLREIIIPWIFNASVMRKVNVGVVEVVRAQYQ